MTWNFGEPVTGGFWKGDLISLPVVSILVPGEDRGLSLAQSPEDTLIEMKLVTSRTGQVMLRRENRRFAKGQTVHFAMDLVPHRADWRAAMKWMTSRYASFFEPPNPSAGKMAGTAGYWGRRSRWTWSGSSEWLSSAVETERRLCLHGHVPAAGDRSRRALGSNPRGSRTGRLQAAMDQRSPIE